MLRKKMLLFLVFVIFSRITYAQVNGAINFDGQNRTFIIYTPPSYTPGNALPLVFVLHGFTQNAQSIMNISGFNAVADTGNFILVYPNGISNAWNTYANVTGGSTANDVGFIEALIDTISANYSIDQNRIYSCGFSAGGFMSHTLACKSSRCFAAIASVAGTMSDSVFNTCSPIFNLPVLQIHGTSDNIVSYNGGLGNKSAPAVVDFWKNRNSCNAAPVISPFPNTNVLDFSTVDLYDYSPCLNNKTVQLFKVNGGGHQWPGTASLLGGLGTINLDINASAEIWKFFRNQSCSNNPQSIQEVKSHDFIITPVSINNYIISGSKRDCKIEVINLNGQQIKSEFTTLPYEINLNDRTPGIYFLKVTSGNEFLSYKLLVH